jgi:molybdate transport system substrate-binding protein
MTMRLSALLIILLLIVSSCSDNRTPYSSERTITIAAAANLEPLFSEMGGEFQKETGIRPVFSYGATGALGRQIANGAPFDLFAAADLRTVEGLESRGEIVEGSKRIYARGKLVLWWPPDSEAIPTEISDIIKPEFKRIAIAKPDVAPYGAAARESLEALGLWKQIEAKIIYGENVSMTRQYSQTGNTDLAFIPLSLVRSGEKYILVDEKLHRPIDQALCIPKRTRKADLAKQFDLFLSSEKGRAALERLGFSIPNY